MKPGIVFILSDARSGSTLLDQVLGAHPEIQSLGEVKFLAAYMLQHGKAHSTDNPLVCTCGEPVASCVFWKKVQANLGKPLDSLCLNLRTRKSEEDDSGTVGIVWRLLRHIVFAYPGSFRSTGLQRLFGAQGLATGMVSLATAVYETTGRPYVVDSTKDPFRFRATYDAVPNRVRAVVLSRDYRAVVHSRMKRGESMKEAALSWRERMAHIAALTRDLPQEKQLRLSYEEFCTDPKTQLRRICDFLGVQFDPTMLARPTEDSHNIGGSPSRFDASRRVIALDTAHRSAFTPKALSELARLVEPEAGRWGY